MSNFMNKVWVSQSDVSDDKKAQFVKDWHEECTLANMTDDWVEALYRDYEKDTKDIPEYKECFDAINLKQYVFPFIRSTTRQIVKFDEIREKNPNIKIDTPLHEFFAGLWVYSRHPIIIDRIDTVDYRLYESINMLSVYTEGYPKNHLRGIFDPDITDRIISYDDSTIDDAHNTRTLIDARILITTYGWESCLFRVNPNSEWIIDILMSDDDIRRSRAIEDWKVWHEAAITKRPDRVHRIISGVISAAVRVGNEYNFVKHLSNSSSSEYVQWMNMLEEFVRTQNNYELDARKVYTMLSALSPYLIWERVAPFHRILDFFTLLWVASYHIVEVTGRGDLNGSMTYISSIAGERVNGTASIDADNRMEPIAMFSVGIIPNFHAPRGLVGYTMGGKIETAMLQYLYEWHGVLRILTMDELREEKDKARRSSVHALNPGQGSQDDDMDDVSTVVPSPNVNASPPSTPSDFAGFPPSSESDSDNDDQQQPEHTSPTWNPISDDGDQQQPGATSPSWSVNSDNEMDGLPRPVTVQNPQGLWYDDYGDLTDEEKRLRRLQLGIRRPRLSEMGLNLRERTGPEKYAEHYALGCILTLNRVNLVAQCGHLFSQEGLLKLEQQIDSDLRYNMHPDTGYPPERLLLCPICKAEITYVQRLYVDEITPDEFNDEERPTQRRRIDNTNAPMVDDVLYENVIQPGVVVYRPVKGYTFKTKEGSVIIAEDPKYKGAHVVIS